jgi:L-iditol 2-dehydrogenase
MTDAPTAGAPPGAATTTPVAVLHGVEDVRLETRPIPVPGPGEVLVEVRSVGVCGSDVHYYREGRIGDFVVDSPLVLGHEASGVVVGRGPGADRHPLGQLVALEPGIPCGTCTACRTGHYNLCPTVRFFATPPVDGTLVGYVVHPEDFTFAVPPTVSEDAAALIEPLSVGIWACRKAAVRPGDRVLVTGGGPIGLLCTAVARASGAAEVFVSDVVAARRDRAAHYGATRSVDPRFEPLPDCDVLIECSGADQAIETGLRALRPAGRAVLVGMTASPTTPLPLGVIQAGELQVTGTFRYASTYPAAIALAAEGAIDLDGLVSGHYRLDQTEEALTASSRDPAVIKPVIRPQE